jgi:hypothetical protein
MLPMEPRGLPFDERYKPRAAELLTSRPRDRRGLPPTSAASASVAVARGREQSKRAARG